MSDTQQRVMNMIARGRLSAVDDADGMQFTQVSLLRGEAKAKVERFQQYGFSGNPPRGSEVVVVFVGGNRDHGVVMSIDNRASRIRGMAEGEVAIYSDEGDYLVLKRGNQIELGTDHLLIKAEVDITIEAPRIVIRCPDITIEGTIALTGDLNVTGNISATGSINAPNGHVGP
jgi:phage baseplate assembly protein V